MLLFFSTCCDSESPSQRTQRWRSYSAASSVRSGRCEQFEGWWRQVATVLLGANRTRESSGCLREVKKVPICRDTTAEVTSGDGTAQDLLKINYLRSESLGVETPPPAPRSPTVV